MSKHDMRKSTGCIASKMLPDMCNMLDKIHRMQTGAKPKAPYVHNPKTNKIERKKDNE